MVIKKGIWLLSRYEPDIAQYITMRNRKPLKRLICGSINSVLLSPLNALLICLFTIKQKLYKHKTRTKFYGAQNFYHPIC